jgi:L-ascorbate metabolism protein UlaG (beta-lactamase superfamily)
LRCESVRKLAQCADPFCANHNANVKRLLLSLFAALVVALLSAAAWLAYQLAHPTPLDAFAGRWMQPTAPAPPGTLRVTFLGVSTLLIDDGETALLTDGFFSRPDRKTALLGSVAPDVGLIAKSLERAGITRLAAVMVGHSHYDHSMDAPEVAKRTGALVVGSESTANVARGWGLPEDRLRVVGDGESLTFGRFRVTMIRSRHVPTVMTGGTIDAPLVPPVRLHKYAEGGSYSMLIEHDTKSLLVHGSAGFVESALRGRRADVVYLGIGLLGKKDAAYRQAYWREVVRTVGAKRVVPIHWDDFFLPLHQPLVPLPAPFDDMQASMAFLIEQGRQDGVEIKLAPAWKKIDPWAALR